MTLPTDLDPLFLKTALALGQEAGQAILQFKGKDLKKERKADNSPVTAADYASDQIIREGLAQAFPDHGILTEEAGFSGETSSPWTWVVDPLDGTKAFARRIPGFCVMIGLLHEGVPHLGVVVDPLEDHTYEAIRGQGAFHTWQGKREKLSVSQRKEFSRMPLVISTGFPEKPLERALQHLGSPLVEPINSVGIKVGLLVRQIGDIYLNHHGVHYWDTCAPQIILEEAGGVFSKLDGSPLSYALDGKFNHQTPTLASNGQRHDDLVQLFRDVGL